MGAQLLAASRTEARMRAELEEEDEARATFEELGDLIGIVIVHCWLLVAGVFIAVVAVLAAAAVVVVVEL